LTSERKTGFVEAFSTGVGGMIGGGIFALGLSLQLAGTLCTLAFLLAGLGALATSYSYSEAFHPLSERGRTIEYSILLGLFCRSILAGGLNIMLLASYIVMVALHAHAFGSYAASLFGEAILLRHVFIALAIAMHVFECAQRCGGWRS